MPHKIALLIHALYGGGAERLMSQLATRWAQRAEVTLITWSTTQTDTYRLPANVQRIGLDLMHPSRNPLVGLAANLQRVRRLRATLRSVQPELILSFSDQMNIVALEAARRLDAPVWISEHSDPAQQRLSRMWEGWRRRTYPGCDGCVALTQGIADYMTRWVAPHKMRVIPPAVDLPPETIPAAAPSTSDSRRQPPTVLYVGRLSREKGADLLLQAWQRVGPQLPDWQLLIAGDGPLRPELEIAAATLPNVHLLGWVAQPWTLYQAADIFVLPSRYEGFPVALLEAMRCGRAAVATRCSSAIDELQAADATCLVDVPCLRPDTFANALLKLAGEAARREEIGQAAARVAAAYAWQHIGPRWDALLPEGWGP